MKFNIDDSIKCKKLGQIIHKENRPYENNFQEIKKNIFHRNARYMKQGSRVPTQQNSMNVLVKPGRHHIRNSMNFLRT